MHFLNETLSFLIGSDMEQMQESQQAAHSDLCLFSTSQEC